jgi:hypothetical protein
MGKIVRAVSAAQLRRLIRALVIAERCHSWMGASPPEDHELIVSDLRDRRRDLNAAIDAMFSVSRRKDNG